MEPTISSLRIKNFKSLRDTGWIELRPITLLVGSNSSGKTAVLQSLLVLKQTLESRNIETPLVLRGKYANLGSFRDIIFCHDTNESLEISLGINVSRESLRRSSVWDRLQQKEKNVIISFRVGYDSKTDRLAHQGLEIIYNGSRLFCHADVIKFKHNGIEGEYKIEGEDLFARRNFLFTPLTTPIIHEALLFIDRKEKLEDELRSLKKRQEYLENQLKSLEKKEEEREQMHVDQMKVTLHKLRMEEERLKEALTFYEKRLSRFLKHLSLEQLKVLANLLTYLERASLRLQDILIEDLYYIGPLREYPQRYYVASGEYPRDVGLRGEYTADVIYSDFKKRRKQYDELKNWIRIMELAKDLELRYVAEGLYALIIADPNLRIDVNLSDIGFGASQLLPILVEGIYAKDNSVLLIEQPEIHLHPRIQAKLADFFIDIAKQGKQLIVETHSEHLLLRLQRRIAENNFSSDDLAIYFFEPSEEGTRISRVKVTEDGIIDEWPKGFFEEDIEESYSLLKALGERRKGVSSD